MRIIKPGNDIPRPWYFREEITCPKCEAVLLLEYGDPIRFEQGFVTFTCEYCKYVIYSRKGGQQ